MCVGFTELDREDRVTLIKQGSFEVIVTRFTPLFTVDGMFTPDMTVLIPRSASPDCLVALALPAKGLWGSRVNGKC